MSTDPRWKQIEKLPKWAQEWIVELNRQGETAKRELRERTDKDTVSPFYVENMLCLERGAPETTRYYIQSDRMCFEHGGLHVDFLYRRDGGRAGAPVLDIQYSGSERMSEDIMFQPRSHQQFYLYLPRKTDER